MTGAAGAQELLTRHRTWLVVGAVLFLAAALGFHVSLLAAGALIGLIALAALVVSPALALPALVLAALMIRREISTGTEVLLNAVTLLIPVLVGVRGMAVMVKRRVRSARSPANLPLILFLGASLLSLLIGTAMWDPAVPRKDNLLLVQLAQWAIFAFSAGAYWLTADLGGDARRLRLMTMTFLGLAGPVAMLRLLPAARDTLDSVTTLAFSRAPLWMLVTALAGGQLLFNRRLSWPGRAFLCLTMAATLAYAFGLQQEAASNWVGTGAALAALLWLRFPRLRWPLVLLIGALTISGLLLPTVYNYAGGDREWQLTGGSRIVLIERVVEVTLRNPVTGLGPAAYRAYAGMKPLPYLQAYWLAPSVNSHNNYVDLFAHGGIVSLALFSWFAVALGVNGLRLRERYTDGFACAYLNGALAAGAGSLVLMMMADWILPHVYNIGFPGFQASVLVWLFLGGIVALEQPDFDAPPHAPEELRPG